jgi:hypothetical protein
MCFGMNKVVRIGTNEGTLLKKHRLLHWILCWTFVWIFCSIKLWWNELYSCLEFFTMYSEVQILIICNNYEHDVGMNCNVKFVET